MNVQTKPPMTVDQYLAWAQDHPGRYELFRGEVYKMSPETVGHIEIKNAVQAALLTSAHTRRIPCHVLGDGATVRIDVTTAYEPDALVYCGEKLPRTSLEVPNPVIVVEVLSPSTQQIDTAVKFTGYFRIPSIVHYLIIDPTKPVIIHHQRGAGDAIFTRIVTDGEVRLDPPGLAVAVADIYAGLQGS
jgi:Uma2 family endonuclease